MTIERLHFPNGRPLQQAADAMRLAQTHQDKFRILEPKTYNITPPGVSRQRELVVSEDGTGEVRIATDSPNRTEVMQLRADGDTYFAIAPNKRIYDIVVHFKDGIPQ
jgi:hypothetical protein